jgi:hypothetical protein
VARHHQEKQIIAELRRIIAELRAIIHELLPQRRPNGARIFQINGGNTMPITGTIPGTTSTFEVDALLNGAVDTAGWPAGTVDTWTTDDPNAVVSPDSGPDVNQTGALDQVKVSLPVTDTQGSAPAGSPPSYNLTASVQMPAATAGGTPPAPFVITVNVPIPAAPVPVPTGGVINQIS